MVQSVQLLSSVWLFVAPWTAACQASLSITNSRSLLKHMSIESVMPSNHLILCHLLLLHLQSFPASGSFQMSQFFASGGQSTGESASASVLPMNTQDWFPWGLTGLLDLTKEAKDVYHKNYITPTQGITEDTDVVCSCSGRLTMVKALSLSITWVDNIRG